MQFPVQITFDNLEPSPALETVVREHAAALNLVAWPEDPAEAPSPAESAPPRTPIEAEYWIDDWR